jgi:hypothetical protein
MKTPHPSHCDIPSLAFMPGTGTPLRGEGVASSPPLGERIEVRGNLYSFTYLKTL